MKLKPNALSAKLPVKAPMPTSMTHPGPLLKPETGRKKRPARGLASAIVVTAGLGLLTPVEAADRADAPEATLDRPGDLTDVFAWMSADATKLNLILNVVDTSFSTEIQYAFHVSSQQTFDASPSQETQIICRFASQTAIRCWAGDSEFVAGDPTTAAGIVSRTGKLRVFAGPRNDPSFFFAEGLRETARTIATNRSAFSFEAGCPRLDQNTADTIRGRLSENASNPSEGDAVASLVVQVDKSLLTGGGPILGVWAATYR